jgi:hypothetical protein
MTPAQEAAEARWQRVVELSAAMQGRALPLTPAQIRARCCASPDGCVACEVDGLPVTAQLGGPAISIEQIDALVAGSVACARRHIAARLTPTQRGQARRAALEAIEAGATAPVQTAASMRAGFRDRSQTRRGRS